MESVNWSLCTEMVLQSLVLMPTGLCLSTSESRTQSNNLLPYREGEDVSTWGELVRFTEIRWVARVWTAVVKSPSPSCLETPLMHNTSIWAVTMVATKSNLYIIYMHKKNAAANSPHSVKHICTSTALIYSDKCWDKEPVVLFFFSSLVICYLVFWMTIGSHNEYIGWNF